MLQTAHLEILKSASSKSTAYLRKVANIVYAVFAHCTGKGKFDPNGPQADPCKAEIDHGHQPLQHHQDHHILEQYRVQRVIHLHLLENKSPPGVVFLCRWVLCTYLNIILATPARIARLPRLPRARGTFSTRG